MKKFYFFCLLLIAIMASYAQAPVVSFACHDENNNSQRLDSVRIENWTRSWSVTIYYPNLTISLADVANGVTEVEFDDEGLARNIPNPFNGRTRAQLTLPNNEHIIMRVFDITGKAVAYYEGQFEAGKHDFDIVLSTPQTYILQVATSRKTYAIKMVNTGNGGENKINLLTSNNEVVLKSAKQIMDYDFEIGDCMHYQGFVTVGNEAVRTDPITQNQYESELITFVLHTQQTTTAPVGVYAGVVGFNNQLYVKPIDVLNNSTQNSFRNFINNLPMGNGTILYHADYTALNNIANAPIPDELINVTLLTFTDGLDLGSWIMNPLFPSETAYLNAVHGRILNDELGGVHITAYSIGVKSSDITDTARFRHDLMMLSSDPNQNVFELEDISELNAQLREVAAQLNQASIVTTDINLMLPVPDPGTRIRFTFDNVSDAASSYYYIEGTYSYSNGVGILSDIVYEGMTSSSGSMVTGVVQGIFNLFTFTDVKDLLQQPVNTGNIKQWYYIPSTQQWQHNSEFNSSNTTSTQQVHNSAIVMLVLDCSSSLGSSGFSTMKSSANNFLDILRNTNTLSAPTVQTNAATTVTDVSATLNGSVTNSGNLIIHECGFVLSLSPNMSNATFYNTNNTTSFNYTVTGLTPNTTYYYRAFARNNRGIGYGATQSFTTPTLPAVTTYSVSNITGYSASCGGTVSFTGNTTVTARGVCYGTSPNPTINGPHTSNGTGGGFFSSSIAGLNPGTTYYVRAYATNIVGTVYGEELSFTTSVVLPEVTTVEITNNLGATATSGGNVTNAGGGTITARGICWSTSANPTIGGSHTINGSGLGSYTSNMTGLSLGTTYYVRSYAANSAGTAYGNQLTFTTPNTPSVTTTTVSEITATTASCGGTVTATGGADVTARGVCWSTSQNPTISNSHTTDGSGTGSFTSSITELEPGIIYYVRAYATNSAGTAYGTQRSFTTQITAPTVVTNNTINNITATTATCGGNVTSTGGTSVTARGICWSTSAYPTVSGSHTTNGTGTGSFTSDITGLTPGTTYYLRAYATNSVGTSYGEHRSFNTMVTVPTVTTNTVSNVTSSSATCGGNVTSTGGVSVTARGVCWSTSPNPTVSDNHTTNGSGTGSFTSNLTGLTSGTTYYVRAYATNSEGTSYGEQWSFTTLSIPTVTTDMVSNITTTTAICGGNVTATGGATVTARGICWSISQSPTVSNDHTTNGTGSGSFTSNMTGLSPGTIYYVRAYATNSVGTSYGEQRSFTTMVTVPTVTTDNVSNVAATSATCGGNVTSTGGVSVTARGVCWSTSQNPTVNDSYTTNGTGSGSFTSSITELQPGTTYYVRAYATNSEGTSYGEQKNFTTLAMITTDMVSSITYSTAICGGYVTSTGGATITARGICWSTSQNPTIGDSHTSDGTGVGGFTSSMTGLLPNTTYYVRAYATNGAGTAYGIQQSFTTLTTVPTVTTNIVSDITPFTANCGGDVTSTGGVSVTARGVCWSTSHNPTVNDSHTTNGTGSGSFTSSITELQPGITYYVRAYATNSEGTSYGEQRSFTTLAVTPTVTTDTVSNIAATTATCGGNVTNAGGASVTARGVCWSTSQSPTVSDSHTTNGTGTGSFISNITGLSPVTTYYVRAYAINSAGTAYGAQQSFTTPTTIPTVTTNTVSNVNDVSATCGGSVTATGGASVTARGVCWSTSQNPTVNDSHTTNDNGIGSFTSNITGLNHSTTYYVRAYATNSVGTGYGTQRSFTTRAADGQPCLGTPTVTDYDNNTYNTVQIGNQCWMKENLRSTCYTNGDCIELGNSSSNNNTTAYRYYPNNNSSNVSTYGYLYNWTAVMHGASSSSANPSGIQGICPNGWHVPSYAEFCKLKSYISGKSQYQCDNNSNKIAKAIASTTGWHSNSGTCTIGYNQNANNSTGFSAFPAGRRTGEFGYYAYFYTATEHQNTYGSGLQIYHFEISYNSSSITTGDWNYFNNDASYSVRCVRND